MRGRYEFGADVSVPVSRRRENKLTVFLCVDKLVEHSLTKLENPRKFGARTRIGVERDEDGRIVRKEIAKCSHNVLAERIEGSVMSLMEHAYRANDIKVESQADYEDRHWHQNQAVKESGVLLHLLNYTRPHCGLSGREVKAWVDLAVSARSALMKWRDSDRKRYAGAVFESGMRG